MRDKHENVKSELRIERFLVVENSKFPESLSVFQS